MFEKNISMPDFAGKTKEEATEWAKKNEITLKTEEADSDKIEAGKVISQSVSKETKVAKRDSMTITVSTGKAMIVPDFSQFTAEEAEGKAEGLQVQVKQLYNNTVPYGRFISQSVESGRKFTEKDDKPVIQVVYSSGKPYIKDLRDSTLEGDLQKIFYDEYQSKGANISYQVYYVDSTVTKGTVVKMSNYNEFVPIDSVIQIGISKGNLKPEANKDTESSD
ncbi:PASTA domain-containing protein [Enterococcus termitis]